MATPHCLTEICEKLDSWIDSHFTDDERCNDSECAIPLASFSFAPNGADCVMIGDVVVWDSESSPGEPGLSFEACRDEYLRLLFRAAPFWGEATKLCQPDRPKPVPNGPEYVTEKDFLSAADIREFRNTYLNLGLGAAIKHDIIDFLRRIELLQNTLDQRNATIADWMHCVDSCKAMIEGPTAGLLADQIKRLSNRYNELKASFDCGQEQLARSIDNKVKLEKELEAEKERALVLHERIAACVKLNNELTQRVMELETARTHLEALVDPPRVPDIDIAEPPRREGSGPLFNNEGAWCADSKSATTSGPKYKVNDRIRLASTLNFRGRITAYHPYYDGRHTYYVKWDSGTCSPALFERDLIPDYLDIGDKVVVHAPHMANHGKTGTVRHYHASVMGLEMDDGSRTTYHSDWLKRVV